MDSNAFDLLDRLLAMNPEHRITAKEALDHVYFKSPPFPCSPECLPKIGKDIHEYQVRKWAEYKQYENSKKKKETSKKAMELHPEMRNCCMQASYSPVVGEICNKRLIPQQAPASTSDMEPIQKAKCFDAQKL